MVRTVVAYLGGIALIVLGVAAGQWQQGRAAEKSALQQAWDAARSRPATPFAGAPQIEPSDMQRVRLSGRWLHHDMVFEDNHRYRGRFGYHVYGVLRLAGGSGLVLVNRGWIEAPPTRAERPVVRTPSDEIEIEGHVRTLPPRSLELSHEVVEGRLWQNVTPRRVAHYLGQPVLGFVVFQESAAPDGLVRDWPRPDFGIDKHRAYAFQWYALAALGALMIVAFALKGAREP